MQVFDFADKYRGTYHGACPFYCSSGYNVQYNQFIYLSVLCGDVHRSVFTTHRSIEYVRFNQGTCAFVESIKIYDDNMDLRMSFYGPLPGCIKPPMTQSF